MSIRYIGSKNRIVDQIMAVVGPPTGGRFVDAFCGTGAVAAAASAAGWPIHLNDQLLAAVCLATARASSLADTPFSSVGGHAGAIRELNSCNEAEGFIWREYSPASSRLAETERRYFTEPNAGRIDAVRARIGQWIASGIISQLESRVLIADLIQAANRVANISGTYGCFLNGWSRQALESLELQPRELPPTSAGMVASVGDAALLRTQPEDLFYVDPPYTKRQYAAYYHVLETIAYGDAPQVSGKTGLRPWRDRASEFCYKRRALAAFESLVVSVAARRVLISYSSAAHVGMDPLVSLLATFGTVAVHDVGAIGRYRPNSKASSAGAEVTEFLLDIQLACQPTVVGSVRE